IIGGGARRTDGRGSDSTIRRELHVLSAAANHAARWKRIGPSANPPTPMPAIEKPLEPAPDPLGENDRLTKAEPPPAVDRPAGNRVDFIILCYARASSRGAVERLTKFQIDLKVGRVNLRHPGEDANRRRSKKRRPIVPISAAVRPVYERLLAETPNEWLFGAP